MREEGLSDYLVLLSVYETCKYRGVSFLKFLLSREDDVETYCRRRRSKRRRPPGLEVYPKGFCRMYRSRTRENDGEGSGRARKSGWKQAVLTFLFGYPETGTMLRDIVDHCIGLIRDGTLVTSIAADNRPRVSRHVSQRLCQMKKAGLLRKSNKLAYVITEHGLGWLRRQASLAGDIRRPDKPSSSAQPE